MTTACSTSVSWGVMTTYKGKIKEQIKFYLSEQNISKDPYMQRIMGGHCGWFPIENFLKFNLLKTYFNMMEVHDQAARMAILMEIAKSSPSDFKLSSNQSKIQRQS